MRATTKLKSIYPEPLDSPPSMLWVSRWLDYTAKYGLSYQLSDGSVGVVFNDNTRMILSPTKECVVVAKLSFAGPVLMILK